MKEGYNIFSPISHSHTIALDYDLPHSFEFWSTQDFSILRHCSKLFVLQLSGWEKSIGVTAEIILARELGIKIEYIKDE